jgi:O-antigen/teichoic acid export membrane protein
MVLSALKSRVGLLLQNKSIEKYFYNTSWLFVEQLVRMTVGLFIGVWTARYLGPDKYGVLSYAQSLVALFAAIATLGLNGIVVRELLKKNVDSNLLLGTAFFMKLCGGLVVLVCLYIAISIIPTDSYTKHIVFIIASYTVFQSFNVIDFYFQARVASKYVVYSNIAVLVISTPIKVLLLVYEAPLEAFALATVIDSIVLVGGLIYFYSQNKESVRNWRFSPTVALGLLKDSWPLILSSISISIGMRVDQVMLKNMIDETSVGFYAAGVKMAEVFNFIPMIIAQSIYPRIIEMDFGKERPKLIYMIRYVFYFLVVFAIGVNLVSHLAVDLLYGAEYSKSIGVVDILIWSIPFTYLNIITSKILLKLNNNVSILLKQAALACINISLNIYLIPRYGIIGAALGTLLADFSLIFFEIFYTKERWIYFLKMEALVFLPNKQI